MVSNTILLRLIPDALSHSVIICQLRSRGHVGLEDLDRVPRALRNHDHPYIPVGIKMHAIRLAEGTFNALIRHL